MDLRAAYDPFRALGGAWKLIRRAPLTMVVGGLLLHWTDLNGAQSVQLQNGHFTWLGAVLSGGLVFGCCSFGLILWLVNTLLQVGFAGAMRRMLGTGEERLSDLWTARGLFLPLLFARALKAVLVGLVTLPFLVLIGGPIAVGRWAELELLGGLLGGLFGLGYLPIWGYILLGLLLTEEAVAFDGNGPIEALRRSWALARGNRIQLLVFALVLFVVGLSGLCACFIGVLATGPWCRIAWFESYATIAADAAPTSEPGTGALT